MKVLLLSILFTISLSVFSQDSKEFFKQGQSKYNAGDYKAAIEFYTKAIEADPKNLDAVLQRGFAYVSLHASTQGNFPIGKGLVRGRDRRQGELHGAQ